MNIITKNIDETPYTGERNVHGKVRVKTHDEAKWQDGAIEFLQKAKAICESVPELCCGECPMTEWRGEMNNIKNPANIVRKVMEHRLEDRDAERN